MGGGPIGAGGLQSDGDLTGAGWLPVGGGQQSVDELQEYVGGLPSGAGLLGSGGVPNGELTGGGGSQWQHWSDAWQHCGGGRQR